MKRGDKKVSRFDYSINKSIWKSKRGQQMHLPFGIIFAIILIIAFIVVAFFVIRHFLCLKDETQSGLFIEDFQKDVDEAWTSPDIDSKFNYNIPGRIDYVCFADFNKPGRGEYSELYTGFKRYQDVSNMFLYPRSDCVISHTNIKHLDIENSTFENNPYCFEVDKGKIEIRLEKGFYETLIRVS